MSNIYDTVKALRATADQLEQLFQGKPRPTLKSELVKHYSEAEPALFTQVDGFTHCSKFDDVMRPDLDGHAVMASKAYELRHSGHSVRLQIRAGTKAKDAVVLAQKILSYVKDLAKDGDGAFTYPSEGAIGSGFTDNDDSEVPF